MPILQLPLPGQYLTEWLAKSGGFGLPRRLDPKVVAGNRTLVR